MKEKGIIDYKKHCTLEEVQQMHQDLEDIVVLVEHQNEILTYKLKNNPDIFAAFIKNLIVLNNQSLKCVIQYYKMLNDALDEYLKHSEDYEEGHS